MRDRYGMAVAGLTLLAALLRFFLIGDKSVWLDEAFSIWLARHPLGEMWGWLVHIDQHPPLYYSLLHGWIRLFGDLQGPVRGLSALCSTLTVPIFYAGVRRLSDRSTALIAAFILALSPFHVRFAQEARMYGLLTLAVAAALYCVARIVTERDAPRRVWWGLAVSQAGVMLTHNTAAVYFPLALNLAVAVIFFNAKAQRRKGKDATQSPIPWLRWLTFQGVVVLLWSPWAWSFVVQSIGVDRQFWLLPPTAEIVWDTFRNFNFSFLPGDLPFQTGWMVLYTVLAFLGVWRLRHRPALWILLSLLVVPLVIALLVSLRRPLFYERTLIWLTLPYYALIAAGIRTIGEGMGKRREGTQIAQIAQKKMGFVNLRNLRFLRNLRSNASTLAQVGVLAIVLFLSLLSLNGYYFWFEKEGWDKAAAYVAANVQPDDLIIFNATWVQIPFDYYYRHYGLETERHGLPVDLFDRGVLEPLMTEGDVAYLRQLVADRPHLWLVYSHDSYTDPSKIIPRELARTLSETGRQHFSGLQVIRYQAR